MKTLDVGPLNFVFVWTVLYFHGGETSHVLCSKRTRLNYTIPSAQTKIHPSFRRNVAFNRLEVLPQLTYRPLPTDLKHVRSVRLCQAVISGPGSRNSLSTNTSTVALYSPGGAFTVCTLRMLSSNSVYCARNVHKWEIMNLRTPQCSLSLNKLCHFCTLSADQLLAK